MFENPRFQPKLAVLLSHVATSEPREEILYAMEEVGEYAKELMEGSRERQRAELLDCLIAFQIMFQAYHGTPDDEEIDERLTKWIRNVKKDHLVKPIGNPEGISATTR